MKMIVSTVTYNSYGGHVTLSLIGDFLLLDAPSFGDALDEIELFIHFRSDSPPRKSLEAIYENFLNKIERLPTVTFRRKKRTAEILFYSDLMTARYRNRFYELSHELFCDGCSQVVENIKLLRKRIRKDDSFDFAEFQSWIEHRLDQLPQSIEELSVVQSEIQARRKSARESLTVWEKTGIDFDDYHPDARSVVDDPRLWDVCDEWAPHGNDTGADVLGMYRDWRKRNRNTKPETFFKQLMQGWQVTIPPDPNDEFSTHTYHQSIVGLAFAQLKLHATCDPSIAMLALESLKEQPKNDLTMQLKETLEKYI